MLEQPMQCGLRIRQADRLHDRLPIAADTRVGASASEHGDRRLTRCASDVGESGEMRWISIGRCSGQEHHPSRPGAECVCRGEPRRASSCAVRFVDDCEVPGHVFERAISRPT